MRSIANRINPWETSYAGSNKLEKRRRNDLRRAGPQIDLQVGRIVKSLLPPGYQGERHLVEVGRPGEHFWEERPGKDPAEEADRDGPPIITLMVCAAPRPQS